MRGYLMGASVLVVGIVMLPIIIVGVVIVGLVVTTREWYESVCDALESVYEDYHDNV